MKKLGILIAFVVMLTIGNFTANAEDLSEISAKGAVVISAQTGEVVFGKNENMKLPMASTTKIMSALIVLENGNLDESFTVDAQAIKVEGSSMGLREGDVVTLRDLCYGMLLPSGNDAANAAAVRVAGSVDKFVGMMNERAEQMGLESTHFVTPSGLDDNTDEHYSTALDMAKLAREAMKNEDFREICSCTNAKLHFGNPPFDRWLTNSNKLLKMCDGCIGIKTGFTDKAKRCLVSACQRDGCELICVTLNAPDDWNDHSKLYDCCFNYFSSQKLDIDNSKLKVNVAGGENDQVSCVTKTASAVLLNGRADKVTAKIHIPRFVYAPVKQGDVVGRAEYYYDGILVAQEDIVAGADVEYKKSEKPGFFEYYYEKIMGIFKT